VRSALGLERFALFGRQAGCPLAIVYSAAHPERVSHLILAEPIVRGSDLVHGPAMAGMEPVTRMTESQWQAFTLAMANISLQYSSQSMARAMAREYRAAMTPPSYAAYVRWRRAFDASDRLAKIEVPTLILSRRRAYLQDSAARVAASIKSARIFSVEPDRSVPGRWLAEETAAVEEFLGIAPLAVGGPDADGVDDAVHVTQRELQVLALIVAGRSNREIAEALVLSERTVARHVANMYAKAGVHGRAEITSYALRHGLV
jgi:DNA-binding CsgD family transcriptional regulator